MRRRLGVLVGFLSVVGVGASAAYYLREPYNPGFLQFPAIAALHVILGAVYLALAPFQFVGRIRCRWLGYHRWAGRLLVAIGLVAGATGIFIAWVIPFSGWWERVVIGFFGGLFLAALGKGFLHIRAGQTALHREWMIRALAIGLGIATTRLIMVPAAFVVFAMAHRRGADPPLEQVAAISVVSFALAFTLHSALAEVWIRRTRKEGAAGSRGGESR